MEEQVDIYTDGACLGNPGPGGWAAILITSADQFSFVGHEVNTTNNRMELLAAIEGISSAPQAKKMIVHSDSQYLVNTMTKNWKKSKNTDLWSQLDKLVLKHSVDWVWVRGHAGDKYNEQADRLASNEALKASGLSLPQGGSDSSQFSHLDNDGKATMVDVGSKPYTERTAIASASVTMQNETLLKIKENLVKKGDVLTVARLAGINAAKKTSELIPLAHQLYLSHVSVDFDTDTSPNTLHIKSIVRTNGQTGVEMEALTAVSIAALTVYDMCKSYDRGIVISTLKLEEKHGGKTGSFYAS